MERLRANRFRMVFPTLMVLLAGTAILAAVLLPRFLPMPEIEEPARTELTNAVMVKSVEYMDDAYEADVLGAGSEDEEETEPSEELLKLKIQDGARSVSLAIRSGTVADALNKAGITLGREDIVSCGLDEELNEDSDIRITHVTREVVTLYDTLPYEIEERETPDRPLGENMLIQRGEEGRQRRVYEVVFHNGEEYERRLLETAVEEEPVDEIIEVGLYHDPIIDRETKTISLWDGTVIPYEKQVNVTATAYSSEGLSWKWTKLETLARVGAVAIDPRYIPLRSKLYVIAPDGSWSYGLCIAEDTGRLIKGYRIDLYFDTQEECRIFGRQPAQVYILPEDYEMPEELLPPDNYAPR